MNNLKSAVPEILWEGTSSSALDKIDEVSLTGKCAVYMLIARRLSCREEIHCKVSVECLWAPAKCNGDGADGARGMWCRKYPACVFLGQNPFVLLWVWEASVQTDVALIILTPGAADPAQTAPWLQKSRVGKTSWANPKATHTWFQGLWALVSAGFRCSNQPQDRNSAPALLPAKSGNKEKLNGEW